MTLMIFLTKKVIIAVMYGFFSCRVIRVILKDSNTKKKPSNVGYDLPQRTLLFCPVVVTIVIFIVFLLLFFRSDWTPHTKPRASQPFDPDGPTVWTDAAA